MSLLADSLVYSTLQSMFTLGTTHSAQGARLSTKRGFSLVEILITVLLVSILSAVAVPRLLTFRDNAGDSAAQQQLRTVALVARSLFDSADSFTGVDLKLVEPSAGGADRLPEIFVVGGGVSAAPLAGDKSKRVSVAVSGTGADAIFVAASPGGNTSCWFIKLSARTPDSFALLTSVTTCSANSAPAPASTDWKANDFPPTP